MSNMMTASIFDMKAVKGGKQLVAYALGPCMGICLYDPLRKAGDLNHIVLPKYPAGNPKKNRYRSADTCITEVLREMERLGASRAQLTAKTAEGARMFEVSGGSVFDNTGQRNIMAARAMLAYGRTLIRA